MQFRVGLVRGPGRAGPGSGPGRSGDRAGAEDQEQRFVQKYKNPKHVFVQKVVLARVVPGRSGVPAGPVRGPGRSHCRIGPGSVPAGPGFEPGRSGVRVPNPRAVPGSESAGSRVRAVPRES